MEKTVNRDKFICEFLSIVKDIKLTPRFLHELKSHPYFLKYKQLLENENEWESDREKVIFILTELTRERSTCNAVIYILHKTGQNELADKLREFNKSLEELPFDTQTDNLIVTTVSAPRATPTSAYFLLKRSRGQCIIINNVESPQSPNIYSNGYLVFEPKGLKRDTERIKNVFEQLHFKVDPYKDWDANKIRIELTNIAKGLGKDEAFALFIITHGQDEKVLGSKACKIIKKAKFENRKYTENEKKQIREDRISTKEIVEIFADKNCPQLASKPKLFFFVCCRVKEDKQESPKRQKKADPSCEILSAAVKRGQDYFKIPKENDYIKEEPMKEEPLAEDTIICYTSAEGYPTYFSDVWGMSYFIQAFTLSIAQYACDQPLIELLNRTFEKLSKFYGKEVQNSTEELEKGAFAIEVRQKAVRKSLHFNPGVME